MQKELCKYLREDMDYYNIAEEIADVEIMLEQLKIIFLNKSDVEETKKRKNKQNDRKVFIMTDKDIKIDGKGCRYKTWDKDCALTGDNHGDNMKPCKFIDEKNCYYKQLKRKEQRIVELNKTIQAKEQECEELKAYAQRQENQREEYYKEFLKKDKALDEIKSICLKDIHTFADGTELRYDSLDDILDIINKAKGEE